MTIDFGRTAADYSCHRAGFPEAFFKRIEAKGIICAGTRVLDLAGNVVAATEALIMQHNPSWSLGGGNGFYPQWLHHLKDAAFVDLETFSFDLDVTYEHDAWRGRIRASAASLDDAAARWLPGGSAGSAAPDLRRSWQVSRARLMRFESATCARRRSAQVTTSGLIK